MATAAPPAPKVSLQEAQTKIRHPLQRLRNWIRGYVTVEGGLVLILYLALWFWIGAALDYGIFKIFNYDWVQEMPWAVRAVVLLLLVAGLLAAVTLKVLLRLFTEFRDAALALVLERRFPKILGDRLITAIELHDTRRAAQQGYSVAMIHQTVQEAAGRVDQLPIKQVFNWKRLTKQTVAVIALTIVSYLLALTGFAIVDSVKAGKASVGDGARDFHTVAGTWFRRDVLLQDVIWPRKAFMQVLNWPSDEVRIGQNAGPQPLRVRAYKWVIADRDAPEGWRPMNWSEIARVVKDKPLPQPPGDWQPRTGESDITVDAAELQLAKFDVRKKDGQWMIQDGDWRPLQYHKDLSRERLGGPEVPKIPEAWLAKHEEDDWTLDQIEQQLNAADNKDKAEYADLRNVVARLERYDAFHNALDALDERLADPASGSRARKLLIPRTVTVTFAGRGSSNTMTLTTLADNEYSGTFTDLKDPGEKLPWTFTFRARGEDYKTPPKKIIVVAAPNLTSIVRQDRRPAYLYYQPGGDLTPQELRGAKQLIAEETMSPYGGDTTRVDLPYASDVTLTFIADKPIQSVRALKKRGNNEEIQPRPSFQMVDDKSFKTTFGDVRQDISFVLEFKDSDGVVGYRSVVIRPAEEHAPDVDLEALFARKIKNELMVTPIARLAFNGRVVDKYGLSQVRFAYAVAPVEIGANASVDAAIVAASVPLINPEGQNYLIGLGYLNKVLKNRQAAEENKPPVQYLPVKGFETVLKEMNQIYTPEGQLLNLEAVRARLNAPQKLPYRTLLKEYNLKPDTWEQAEFDDVKNDFPMAIAKLLETDAIRTQRRYRVQLWLEGVNTDVEADPAGEPRISPSKDKFVFLVVSEADLLAEINKEEEGLYGRLDDVQTRLQEQLGKLTTVTYDLDTLNANQGKSEQFGNMSSRADEVDQVLDKTQAVVKEVLADYTRILQELRINQIKGEKIAQVDKGIVKPLGEIDDLAFPKTRDRVANFRKVLDDKNNNFAQQLADAKKAGKDAKDQLQDLIGRLHRVTDEMQGLIDLAKLIESARQIEMKEKEQADILRIIKGRLLGDIFGGSDEKPTKPKDK